MVVGNLNGYALEIVLTAANSAGQVSISGPTVSISISLTHDRLGTAMIRYDTVR